MVAEPLASVALWFNLSEHTGGKLQECAAESAPRSFPQNQEQSHVLFIHQAQEPGSLVMGA